MLAGKWRTIYVGVTNDLERGVWEHKNKAVPGFTARYCLDRLVYFEQYSDIRQAIAREKQLKAGWMRFKKAPLIESKNPDLATDWYS